MNRRNMQKEEKMRGGQTITRGEIGKKIYRSEENQVEIMVPKEETRMWK